ncbi:MAG: GNAT family N-acetyltransferase [Burkholderiales bacterium]|nr:GNAT family N-acetyltransferase [Burkholderiales bacterium]
MPILVHPLTADRWSDLENLFNAKGCSIARSCWCMYYRRSGKRPELAPGQTREQQNHADLKALSAQDVSPGLIGYLDGVPVGWLSLGPREDFAKLHKSPVMKAVDEQPVWSIICFVVPSPFRRQGVAKAMLAAAVDYARQRGVRLLEAYPVDLAMTPEAESLWFGSKTMFDEAGFEEVARRKPGRPVVRLKLIE